MLVVVPMHEEWPKVTDKGEVDTCAGRSVGPLQAKAQTPRDGVVCSSGEVKAREVGVDFD